MGWLDRWRGRGSRGAEVDVVVVSRAGCHLCVEMEQVVSGVLAERPGHQARRGRLRVVDLDQLGRDDPALLERWTTRVPVLLVEGEEVAHWSVDPETVRTALRR